MKKNIEWLKEKVLELQNNGNPEANQTEAEREIGRLQKWAWDNCVDRVYELINQLDELTVEEEQKYNVSLKFKSSFGTVGIFLYKEGDEVLAGDNFKAYCPKEDECRLTEQEIRDFQNGDILFEHFAVKVEELEE